MNEQDNKDFLYDALCEMFDEKYHNLIHFIIFEVANYPIKSELYMYESLVRKIIMRDELKLQARDLPYVVNTATTIKVHPIHKAIRDLDDELRILMKDLAMSKVSLKQYSTAEQMQDMADSKVMIGMLDLLILSMNKNVQVPKEVEEFVQENGDFNGEVKKSDIIKFCNENEISTSFLKYIQRAE